MRRISEFVGSRFFGVFGVAVVLLWVAIAFALRHAQHDAMDRANVDGRNLARSLAEHQASSVRAIDIALKYLRDEWIRDSASFAAAVARQQAMLEDRSIYQIVVTGADGRIRHNSLSGSLGADISNRQHLSAFKERGADELDISAPFLSSLSSRWITLFERPIYDSDHRFAGAMSFSVQLPALEQVYNDIQLGEGGVIALARADGQVLAHSRDLGEAVNISLADSPAFRPDSPDSGHYRRLANTDGVDRLYAFHKVARFPLTVLVGQSADTVFAPYYAQRRIYLAGGALVTLVLLAATLLLISRKIDSAGVDRSRAQLAAIVHGSGDGIVSLGIDGRIQSWNAGAERLFGYTAAEAIGRKSTELIVPPDRMEELVLARERVDRGESVPSFDTVRLAKNGRRMDVAVSMSPVRDLHGRVSGISAILRDISERKRVEAAFRQREEDYRRLFALASEGIWVVDADAVTTMVNPSMASMLGYAPDEMLGRHMSCFMDEQAAARADQFIARCKTGTQEQHDFEFIRKDGTPVIATVETAPILNEDGVYVGSIAGVIDITERKRMELALQSNEQRLRTLFDSFPIGVAYMDMAERVTFVNRVYRESYGDPAGAVAPGLHEFVGSETYAIIEPYVKRALAGEEVQFERSSADGDGLFRTWSLHYYPDRNVSGEVVGIFGMRQDITERKRVEEQVRKLNRDLERRVRERTAELIATIDALQSEVEERRLAEASALTLADRVKDMARRLGQAQEVERRRLASELHDGVCSNLAAIGLNLALLKQQLPLADAAAMERRLSGLIGMIDETKANAKDISVDLRPLLLEDRDLLSALQEFGRKIEASTGMAVLVTGADSGRRLSAEEKIALFRIAQEALTNCAKHAHAKAVAIELTIDAEHSVLSIADDGIGADLTGIGANKLGLGLLSMQERAEAVGGNLRIESAPGRGTRVSVEVGTTSFA